jgi:HlyD family secretion protein
MHDSDRSSVPAAGVRDSNVAPPITGAITPRPMRTLRRSRSIVRWALGATVLTAIGTVATLLMRAKPLNVELATAAVGVVRASVDVEGRTRIVHRHTVVAPGVGVLSRITLRAGDTVTERQIVAELTATESAMLDPRTEVQARELLGGAQAALAQARTLVVRTAAARALADRELARARALEAAGAIPEQQTEQLEVVAGGRAEEHNAALAGVRIAQHEVASARAAFGGRAAAFVNGARIQVRSPMYGVVLRVLHEDEGVVLAGTPLLEVGDPASIEVSADVLSDDAARLRTGAPARIFGWGGDTLGARVQRIEPHAATQRSSLGVDEQRVRVVMRLETTARRSMPLGDNYRVETSIEQAATGRVTMVPSGAVVRRGGDNVVFAYEKDRAVAVPVTVGLRNAEWVEIRDGLRSGARVVLYPPEALTAGTRITPR